LGKVFLAAVKILACCAVFIAGCFFATSTSQYLLWWGIGIGVIITVIVVSNIGARDYGKEPVTDAEARKDVIKMLVNHLESEEHGDNCCDPCPVPDLLKKIDPERV